MLSLRYKKAIILLLVQSSQCREAMFNIFLIDSNFVTKSSIETPYLVLGNPEPDSIVKAGVGYVNENYAEINSEAYQDAWLVYELPRDPGTIAIVSNTEPPKVLIKLKIDAMMAGGFHTYEYIGNESKLDVQLGSNQTVVPIYLNNNFMLGDTLSEGEIESLSRIAIPDTGNQFLNKELVVLDIGNGNAPEIPNLNPEGIQYLAYYSNHRTNSSINYKIHLRLKSHEANTINILGRKVSIQDIQENQKARILINRGSDSL